MSEKTIKTLNIMFGKKIERKQTTIIFLLFVVLSSYTLSAQSVDEIMEKHDNVLRESYVSMVQKIELSTCKYAIKQGRLNCIGKPRTVVVESVRKRVDDVKQDFYSLTNVLEPVTDKGIGLLYYEYYDSDKDNDNWIYLPALGKVKRIISSTSNSDDSGNFLGTEFSTEDMQIRKIVDYNCKILREETYDNRPTWVIEMIPTEQRKPKTKYGKIIAWIDKERYTSIKEDLYDHNGTLYKQHVYKDYERVDDVWTPRRSMMINFSNRRVTVNDIKRVGYNFEVSNEFFSQRTFIDYAYRERNMEKFREHCK